MSKIAILDTSICPESLHCREFYTYNACGEGSGGKASETSHGTICARVLDYFTSGYELFNIQILKDSGKILEKPMGNILHLKKGLELCLELDVDIVCMSAVSSILSDSSIIYETVYQLAQKSILMAALDNRRYITVPTAYPFVAGVQSDTINCLHPGGLAYNNGDLFYAGLYANCNIGLLKELGCPPSNSFAVPAAAAQFNTWKNEGKYIKEEIQNLKPYPVRGAEGDILLKKKMGLYRELPLVVVYALGEEDTYAACQETMDKLYSKYDVQSTALCSMEAKLDVRFRKIESVKGLKQELLFMECCYKTDLIFLAIEKNIRELVMMQVNADLEILLDSGRMRILFEDSCVEGDVAELEDLVYKILQ
ncbi:hypothetical protein D3Z47_19365 [Lachnospiraceae bacterium]|nr:hypothetical protein [Lachnospiraceae bacterium]